MPGACGLRPCAGPTEKRPCATLARKVGRATNTLADYFRIRYRGKMVFLILVHDLHLTRLTHIPPQKNLSYTNTSKLTWNKPLLLLFSQSLTLTIIQSQKKKGKTPIYLAHEIICYRLTHTYLPRSPSLFVNNLCSYSQSNAYFSFKNATLFNSLHSNLLLFNSLYSNLLLFNSLHSNLLLLRTNLQSPPLSHELLQLGFNQLTKTTSRRRQINLLKPISTLTRISLSHWPLSWDQFLLFRLSIYHSNMAHDSETCIRASFQESRVPLYDHHSQVSSDPDWWCGLVWFILWHINHCRLFHAKSIFIHINSSISNNSVQHKNIFVYTQLNVKNSSISNIQFSISTPFSFVWPIYRTLSGATTPGQSGPMIISRTLTVRPPTAYHAN